MNDPASLTGYIKQIREFDLLRVYIMIAVETPAVARFGIVAMK
jgi:hypothetical protein